MQPLILDVRSKQEHAIGHVPGAILIPTPPPPLDRAARARLATSLQVAMRNVPRERPVWIYCQRGRRSKLAQTLLREMGFRKVEDLGGIDGGEIAAMVHAGQLAWKGPPLARPASRVRLPGPARAIGAGDIIAKATKAVGIKPCGGCQKRQRKLNRLLSFGGKKASQS